MRRGISQEGLKIIACVTMLIDHIGAIFVPGLALRAIGRISFPLFCFLIAEGAYHTRNPGKYAFRLLVGVLLAELPFDLAFFGGITWHHQSVMVTLLLGLLGILGIKNAESIWGKAISVLPILVLARFSHSDYGIHGVLVMLLFGLTREMPWKHLVQALGMLLIFADKAGSILFTIAGVDITLQMLGALSIVPIALYSGEKRTYNKYLQWGFYLFYPAHLLLLTLFK